MLFFVMLMVSSIVVEVARRRVIVVRRAVVIGVRITSVKPKVKSRGRIAIIGIIGRWAVVVLIVVGKGGNLHVHGALS